MKLQPLRGGREREREREEREKCKAELAISPEK